MGISVAAPRGGGGGSDLWPGALRRGAAPRNQVPDQGDGKQNDEDDEQRLGNACGTSSDAAIAQCRRDDGDDEKDHGARKSTRLNSSHVATSYAVFRLKKKDGRQ